jgi:acyl dehydratase
MTCWFHRDLQRLCVSAAGNDTTSGMARTVNGIEEIRALAGQDLGESEWRTITQEEVNAFADVTGDHQYIHIDPERAKATSFGGTIAHGFFTLSLSVGLLEEIVSFRGTSMNLNYGLNKVRFPAPVPVGSTLRMKASMGDVEEVNGGVQTVINLTYEIEGQERPPCVAELVLRFLS